MTCDEFRALLDEQGPQPFAHCVACEEDLRAAREIERLLAEPVHARTSEAFDDAVFRRIHRRKAFAAIAEFFAEPLLPLAMALLVIVLLRLDTIASAAVTFIAHLTIVHAVLLAPLLYAVSWRIFRGVTRELEEG